MICVKRKCAHQVNTNATANTANCAKVNIKPPSYNEAPRAEYLKNVSVLTIAEFELRPFG